MHACMCLWSVWCVCVPELLMSLYLPNEAVPPSAHCHTLVYYTAHKNSNSRRYSLRQSPPIQISLIVPCIMYWGCMMLTPLAVMQAFIQDDDLPRYLETLREFNAVFMTLKLRVDCVLYSPRQPSHHGRSIMSQIMWKTHIKVIWG